jgi:hypothetical protein
LNSRPTIELSAGLACPFVAAGCSSVVSLAGANFPVWILCFLAGIAVALASRRLFVAVGVDEWIAPRVIVYFCLALVVASLCWLTTWR